MLDMSERTKQELFDIVVRGLAKQGWAKSLVGGRCVYNGPGDIHCAAGHILVEFGVEIPEGWNDASWVLLVNRKVVCDTHTNFIRDLQHMHDSLLGEPLERKFRNFAIERGFTWPLDEA